MPMNVKGEGVGERKRNRRQEDGEQGEEKRGRGRRAAEERAGAGNWCGGGRPSSKGKEGEGERAREGHRKKRAGCCPCTYFSPCAPSSMMLILLMRSQSSPYLPRTVCKWKAKTALRTPVVLALCLLHVWLA